MSIAVIGSAVWHIGEVCFFYLVFYHFFPSAWEKRMNSDTVKKERKWLAFLCAIGVVLFHVLFYPPLF